MHSLRKLSLLLLVYSSQQCFADFKDGGDAYISGDYATAAAEFIPLAKKGDHRAMYALGSMYAAGHGVEKDLKKSYALFREAAQNGRPDAMHKLGLMYEQGLGAKQDLKKAARMYQKSAKLGYPLGQYRLGLMYADGNGIKQNIINAYAWLVVAGHYFIFELAKSDVNENNALKPDNKHQLILFQQQEKDRVLDEIISKLQSLRQGLNDADIEIIRQSVIKYRQYRSQYSSTNYKDIKLESSIESLFLPETLY